VSDENSHEWGEPRPVSGGGRSPADVLSSPSSERARRSGQVRPIPVACRQISHDIHHELGMISLLATLLSQAPDIGSRSLARVRLMVSEIRWLDQLQRAHEECLLDPGEAGWSRSRMDIRLDRIAAEVVDAIRLSSTVRIELVTDEVTARADRLAVWRVLRNVIDNAVRAAGPSGTVKVRITSAPGWAVAHVDDDGPGFGATSTRPGALGLGIAQDLATAWGGGLEIGRGELGGGSVRLRLPTPLPRGSSPVGRSTP
jgi:signal transduction histidine kinase